MTFDYTPRTLRYDRAGVDWMVEHALELRSGIWPGDMPYEQVEFRGKRISCRASFENIVLIIAELDIRVKRCGLDGFLVEEKMLGKDEAQIARERCLYRDYVKSRINKVLWYCASGSWAPWIATQAREGLTYDEFKRLNLHTQKLRLDNLIVKTS